MQIVREYKLMPKVVIDEKVYVRKDIFKRYILYLLEKQLNTEHSYNQEVGLKLAMDIISKIR